ncbi:MAG: ankyrin repeat domain-containing protein [bacterium]
MNFCIKALFHKESSIRNNTLIKERSAALLMAAAGNGNLKAAELLIQHGAGPELFHVYENTALHYAMKERNCEL